MKKPRILFITHAYYNRGGVEEHIKTLAQVLSNFEIGILTPVLTGFGVQHYQLIYKNIPLLMFQGPELSWPMPPFQQREADKALKESIRQFKPDIIHIHHLGNWPTSMIEQVIETGLPVVKSFHDYYCLTPHFTMEFTDEILDENSSTKTLSDALVSKEYSVKIFGKDFSIYLLQRREYLQKQLSKLSACIAPSQYAKAEHEKVLSLDLQIISHGITHFEIPPKIKGKESILRFGYIGSLIRQKGIQTLIDAFKNAREKSDSIELHLYGGGQINTSALPSGIKWFGNYRRNDLPHILSEFDIGIIPSIFKETFCYTLSELFLAKKAVIASSIGALSERVIPEKNGLLVKPGDSRSLEEAILLMADEYHSKSWDIEIPKSEEDMALEYTSLYNSLLNNSLLPQGQSI